MTVELTMLVYSCLLLIAQSISILIPYLVRGGFLYGLGNRDAPVEIPAWGERAVRAHRNMMENLLPFAALVLAAHVAGVSDESTERGAQLFFWARLAFAPIYIAGIPYLRTVVFVVAIGGMFEFVGALLRA